MGEQGLPVHEEGCSMGKELTELVENSESMSVDVTPIEVFPVVQPFDVGEVPEAVACTENDRRSSYRRKGEEVDFVIIENETVSQLIQVCYNMTFEDTREREIRALKKGMHHFGLDKGMILTLNQEESINGKDFEITVVPISKWLLET